MSRRRDSSLADLLRDRQVIPRWKSPAQAARDSERTVNYSAARIKAPSPDWIKELKAQLGTHPSVQTANELQETAFILGVSHEDYRGQSPTSASAAREVEKSAKHLDLDVSSSAEIQTGLFDKIGSVAPHIRALRERLAEHPGQALLWSELARHYLTVGSDKKARNAMECALQISGTTNRYIARSATRMFVHLDDQDRALHLLRKHNNIRRDPWLISSEIAVSGVSGKSSNLVKLGQSLVADRNSNPLDTSELASAIGTLEHTNGKRRAAESYFRASLVCPTENSLAQAQWAQDNETKVSIPASAWDIPGSYEAQAMAARTKRKWGEMLQFASAWLRDEPFSLRPAAVGSSIGLTYEHNVIGERFASAGLMSAPRNPLLLNNRAVSRAYLGKLDGAMRDISLALMDPDGRKDPHLLATIGLLAYRAGHFTFGSECYLTSLSWFSKKKDRASVTLGALHWLREEIRIGSPISTEMLDILKKQCVFPEVSRAPETLALLEIVEDEISSAFGNVLAEYETSPTDSPQLIELQALSAMLMKDGEFVSSESASKAIQKAHEEASDKAGRSSRAELYVDSIRDREQTRPT